ncbi:MAG: hypothetical protein MPK10_08195 [Gammaproteobacteria bacterium]|nr:hypothetical protein [Gammaproteobacteria bacterium]
MNREAAASSVEKLSHYIGGRRVPGASGRFGDVYDPAVGAGPQNCSF